MIRAVFALCCAISALALLTPARAQTQSNRKPQLPIVAGDRGGDLTSAVLDELILLAKTQRSTIIVVSRLGRTEQSAFNYRRLHNALTRLIDYPSGLPKEQVIGAIGERTDAHGRVEFFFQGVLWYVVNFGRNRDFTVDCCWETEPARQYYPDYRGRRKFRFP